MGGHRSPRRLRARVAPRPETRRCATHVAARRRWHPPRPSATTRPAMAWYHRVPAPKLPPEQRKSRMEGLWIKCDGCGEIIYKQDVEKNLEVCPKCDEHFPLPVRKRLELVLDPGTFTEHDVGLESTDPLQVTDSKKYRDRIKASQKS